jgi:hypothetical protein
MFENRLVREKLGPKNDEVIESWSKRKRILRQILNSKSDEDRE